MLLEFAVIFIAAFSLYWLFERMRLPGILGMLFGGALLGPQILGFIDQESLQYADELGSNKVKTTFAGLRQIVANAQLTDIPSSKEEALA